MRAVNLLPPDERRKGLDASARKPLLGAAAGIALVALLATFMAVLASFDASDTRSQLEAVEQEIAALPEPQQPAVDVNALVQERTDRQSALAVALSDRIAFDSLLRQVALVLPGDAWLTQLSAAAPLDAADAAAPPAAAAATESRVTIQGATWSHDDVAVVLARLASVPTLVDVRLTSAARVEPQGGGSGSAEGATGGDKSPGKPYVTFVISANVRTGDES